MSLSCPVDPSAGRVQTADIVIVEVLPDSALRDIDLSTVESLVLGWKQNT
jgi:hypothetical protein